MEQETDVSLSLSLKSINFFKEFKKKKEVLCASIQTDLWKPPLPSHLPSPVRCALLLLELLPLWVYLEVLVAGVPITIYLTRSTACKQCGHTHFVPTERRITSPDICRRGWGTGEAWPFILFTSLYYAPKVCSSGIRTPHSHTDIRPWKIPGLVEPSPAPSFLTQAAVSMATA